MKRTKNPAKEAEYRKRAADLVAQMTLHEKVGQMLSWAPAIERLGIPAYNWWSEGIHGIGRAGTATVFPQAIGMAAAFDEDMMEQVGNAVGVEARGKYNMCRTHGDRDIFKGLTVWAPNINIFRDPRWGRGHETYGEDPFLTSRLGVRFVEGMQGDDPDYLQAAACAKHFAVHSGPESDRHHFNAIVSKQDLWETYLPAFRALVKEAGVEAVMGAYNRTNGEPCCGSKTLLKDILRDKWQFDGHVTSDCWAIKDFHTGHMVTDGPVESVALAVNNGCDLNCGDLYVYLEQAVAEGKVSEEKIDESLTRLYVTRMRLGMFDTEDQVPYNKVGYDVVDSAEMKALNLKVADSIMTLLKNDGTLPLDKSKLHTVGVIGPNADSRKALLGNYEGTASRYTTVLEGIEDYLGDDVKVRYSQGCHLYADNIHGLAESNELLSEVKGVCEESDVVIAVLGLDSGLEGEEGDNYELYRTLVPIGTSDYQAENQRLECGIMISSNALKELGEDEFIKMMRFVDWLWYSDEGLTLTKWGKEGETYTVTDGTYSLTPGYYCNGLSIAQTSDDQIDLREELGYACGNFMYSGNTELLTSNFSEDLRDFYDRQGQYRKLRPLDPTVTFDEDQMEMLNLWGTPMTDTVNAWTCKFAMNQADINNDWDTYVAEVEAQNMQNIVDMYNDTYKASK